MKRGSSVLLPPLDAAKRQTHATNTHLQTPSTHSEHTHTAGSSPQLAATSLFSPDVSTKMASDLLIRLSEATQKAQVHPGSGAEGRGGQQDEPGLALSPDGPGASPEPPSFTHTPDGTVATDTLASVLLKKLAESQEVSQEEEEPTGGDTSGSSGPISPLAPNMATQRRLSTTAGTQGAIDLPKLSPGARIADRRLCGPEVKEQFFCGGSKQVGAGGDSGAAAFQLRVKMEDGGDSAAVTSDHRAPGANMDEQFLSRAKMEDRFTSGAKMEDRFTSEAKMEDWFTSGAKMEDGFTSGAKMEDGFTSGAKMEDGFTSGAKMEDGFTSGAKMVDMCLRAVLWQDMSVNLASTLLHQLSERVSKSNGQLDRTAAPISNSHLVRMNGDLRAPPPLLILQEPPQGAQSSVIRCQTTGFFYRCHVCGFETEGRVLFQSHMTEHRQREHGSFSLRCCVCDYSTNQEAAMRSHADTHVHGNMGTSADMRCTIAPTAAASSAPPVAKTTLLETSTSEHRCRICQRSFPGQQELLVHFQGHRQGNQYRCDRCGHLTRTANKLVEHVRVHTGERPFTCDLCPYSAKRRDSLRLHRKVKHAAHGDVLDAHGDVHTHRSYAHADNQRLHTHTHSTHSSSPRPPLHPSFSDRAGWSHLSPLVPITTLISLRPRCPSSSSSSSSSSDKHFFFNYLGLTSSL